MEAFAPFAWIAWQGFALLIGLIAGASTLAKPVDPAPICYQERDPEGPAFARCVTSFTLPEPDSHWMVRR